MKNKRLILEKIKPKEESSSFSWLINPKLNDFYFWHFHPEYELVYIEAKEGQRHVGDHIGKFHDSDLVLIGSNVPHLNFDFGIKTEYQKTVLHILPNFIGDENIYTPELKSIKILLEKSRYGVCFGPKVKEEIGEKFKKTERKPYFQQFISILEILKVLSETQDFILLNHQATNLSFNKKEEDRLRKVYSFIENNYERKIDLGEISEISNLSKAAFCRYFKKMTKLPFTVFFK